jgi:hypothetical protein
MRKLTNTPSDKATQVAPAALSVDEFCTAHRISRALFYLLQKDGSGPRLMRVRGRTLITTESAADWRKCMESEQAVA